LLAAVLPSFEDSERLAQMDIERYGIAKVRFSGTREKPFYSTVNKLALCDGKISMDTLAAQRKMLEPFEGGNMTMIELGDVEGNPDELMALTRQLSETCAVEFFTYNRKLTYCSNCKRSWFGILPKCPSCGATSTLTQFSRN
jgi:anaerobic ribonucleoside-triphosphate reductase